MRMNQFKRKTRRRTQSTFITPPQLTKRITNVINRKAEKKYALDSYNTFTISKDQGAATDSYFLFTDTISVGNNDNNQRSGDQIRLISLNLRFYVQLQKGATTGNDAVAFRLVIFRLNEAVNSTGSTGSALQAIYPVANILAPGAGSVIDVTSTFNHDRGKAGLYTILLDRHWTQTNGPNAGSLSNTMIKYFNIKMKFKNNPIVQYIANSTTNAKGHIGAFIISQNLSIVANPPNMFGSAKVMYVDY